MSEAPRTRGPRRQATATSNGRAATTPNDLAAAIASEQAIADAATAIRGDATELTAALFWQLYPLLRQPIPPAFIQTIGVVTGKPYVSTGVRSVQVQIDRLNNVLTPLWWHDEVTYNEQGTLAHVTVHVHVQDNPVRFSSPGGVDRGSTLGNVFKGSYTNAAKRAYAALGPGHEVYVGAADMDPDVSEDAAKEQAKTERRPAAVGPADDGKPIPAKKAREIVDAAWLLGLDDKLQLAASHVLGDDVGDCSKKTVATEALSKLTRVQAAKVEGWLSRKADEQAAGEEAGHGA